jgi:hypothetical protein
MLRRLSLLATLVLAGVLAWIACRTPAPVPVSAPAAAFSAARAMADIQVIAASPHPTGSPENAKVRDYLAQRMRDLGLEVRIQAGEAFEQRPGEDEPWVSGAKIENVIGVLPGRDRSLPALAVMAHYDSVPGSPGAADDGAGVASALETARALKAAGGPDRDVAFVLTDGEEAGLIGARAFWADDPLAPRIKAVVNMDTRGGGGRSFMFESGRGDGETIARFQQAAAEPSSNSLAAFVYAHMPNGTDFTVAKDKEIPGLNFAFIGRPFDYHSASATPGHLERGALQHMGQQVLAATRELARSAPLPKASDDVVFSDLLGQVLVAYPTWAGWGVLAGAGLLFAFAARRAARVRPLSRAAMLRGVGGALAALLSLVPVADLARQITGAGDGLIGLRSLTAQFPLYDTALGAFALSAILAVGAGLATGRGRRILTAVPLLTGVAAFALGGFDLPALICGALAALLAVLSFGKPVDDWSGWSGVMILVGVLALALQVFAPTTAFLAAWPLLAASLVGAIAALTPKARLDHPLALLAALAAGAVTTAQLAALGHALVLGVGLELPAVISIFVLLALPALYPLIAGPRGEEDHGGIGWAGALFAAGLVLALVLRLHPFASPRTPRPTEVLAVADLDTGKFYRAAPLPKLDAWSREVLKAEGGAMRKGKLPALTGAPMSLSDAKRFEYAAPAYSWVCNYPVPQTPDLSHHGYIITGDDITGFSTAYVPRPPFEETNETEEGAHLRRMIDVAGSQRTCAASSGDPSSPAPLQVEFALNVPDDAVQLRLDLKASAPVTDVLIDERPITLLTTPGKWSHLVLAAPRGGVLVSFKPTGHGKLEARWAIVTPGWPAEAKPLPPRPADLMPWSLSDSTVTLQSIPAAGRPALTY